MEFNLDTIVLGALLVGQVVATVVAIRKPNEKQDVTMATMTAEVTGLKKSMDLLQANHLPHIEAEVKEQGNRLARIETILDERLPRKEHKYGS